MNSPDLIRRVKDDSGKGTGLELVWSGGPPIVISAQKLRDFCPCATCEELRGKQVHAKPLSAPKTSRLLVLVAEPTKEDIYELKRVWGIGNYAVGLEWGDGHNSGIYTYSILRDLSKPG